MALRKRGLGGMWSAYYRQVYLAGGKVRSRMTTVALGTSDLAQARLLEGELLKRNREHAARLRLGLLLDRDPARCDQRDNVVFAASDGSGSRRRLKIADALQVAEKYRPLGYSTERIFRRFSHRIGRVWMHEITPEIAFDYLRELEGKTYNNTKGALNVVFRLTLLESGLQESPLSRIPSREERPEHQRPLTEDEFRQVYRAAKVPWNTAVLIAWYTGLRRKDVLGLRWSSIDGDVLTTVPAKTARFGRGVRIPLHPQLLEHLRALPRKDDRIFGPWPSVAQDCKRSYFAGLLQQLGIVGGPGEIVNFNSLRDSFVTRCDEAQVPRHAVRGIVGHVSDDQTDLYSHDLASARMIQSLPRVEL